MRPSAEFFRRRDFLRLLAGATAFAGFGLAKPLNAGPPSYPFSEVPPSTTGISWVHTAGKSTDKFLPEISGAGCAFLDYDNDGWMDIYFVNSGRSDFYTPNPPLRNALYRNNRDGTFTDVDRKSGSARKRLRHGCCGGGLQFRWLSRHLCNAI